MSQIDIQIPEGKEIPASVDELMERGRNLLKKLETSIGAQDEKVRKKGKVEFDVASFYEFGLCYMKALALASGCMNEMRKFEKILRQVSGEYDMLAYLREHKEALENLMGGKA